METTRCITLESFCEAFDRSTKELPELLKKTHESINTNWRMPTLEESEEYILTMLKRTYATRDSRDEEVNREAFEKGWSENLQLAKSNGICAENLRPRYFRESKFFRFAKKIIIPENPNLEYDLFTLSRLLVFTRFLSDFDEIYEFGCGSCGNVHLLSQTYPDKSYVGLDWTEAAVEMAQRLGKETGMNVSGRLFNFLRPDESVTLSPKRAVLTIHALEQIGDNFGNWIEYLLKEKPGIVINYEPLVELYDPDNLYDALAIKYCEMRGYLNGYLTTIRRLAQEGKVEILKEVRPCIGGIWHEASLIVWRPI